VASRSIPGGRSLRPVKYRKKESFVKGVNQNFPLFFTDQFTPLTKLLFKEE